MRKTEWASREEWAKERRTAYADLMPDVPGAIADYATPEEIEALKKAIRELWKSLGRQMRGFGEYESRELWHYRKAINRGLQLISEGELPLRLEDYGSAAIPLLAPFHARYEATRAELYKQKAEEIAARSIDDAAWNKELEQREQVDRWLASSSVVSG